MQISIGIWADLDIYYRGFYLNKYFFVMIWTILLVFVKSKTHFFVFNLKYDPYFQQPEPPLTI